MFWAFAPSFQDSEGHKYAQPISAMLLLLSSTQQLEYRPDQDLPRYQELSLSASPIGFRLLVILRYPTSSPRLEMGNKAVSPGSQTE